MATNEELAARLWPILCAYAEARQRVTYGDLPVLVGGGSPTGIGSPLGIVRAQADGLGVPTITAIAVNKDTGMPADQWVLPRHREYYDALSEPEQKEYWHHVVDEVFDFTNWDDVLRSLGLQPMLIAERGDDLKPYAKYGFNGGEGEIHRQLKMFIRDNPREIEIDNVMQSLEEFPLPSGDRVDVYHEANQGAQHHLIEVKPFDHHEIYKGVFQAIKYRSVMAAWKVFDETFMEVKAYLVIQAHPNGLQPMPTTLNIARKHSVSVYSVQMPYGNSPDAAVSVKKLV